MSVGPGDEIDGYVIEATLGRGGMGAVFRARHPAHGDRRFALKVLAEDDAAHDPRVVARFRREMEAVAAASALHPGIVRVHAGSVTSARPYLVLELVDGEPLSALAGEEGLEPRKAAALVREVADAIAHVHARGILHRDLKPENVLVEPSGRPRILDFGLARVLEASRLTRSSEALGTPLYAAPEQLDGRGRELDARADVYGLGGVLYFALAGRAPFQGSQGPALLRRVLLEPVPPPSRFAPAVPPELDAVCLEALEKERIHRYPDAPALRDDLDRVLRGEPPLARLPSGPERLARRLRTSRPWLAAAGLALLLLGALALGAGALVARARRERARDDARKGIARARGTADLEALLRDLAAGEPGARALVRDALEARADRDGASSPDAALVFSAAAALARIGVAPERPAALEARALALLDDEVAARRLGAGAALARIPAPVREREPLARALADLAALERAGAPVTALGPCRAEAARELAPDLLARLEAASALPAPAGPRRAWLLADLLALAGRPAEARAALARAVLASPSDPARAPLERAHALAPAPSGLAPVLDELAVPSSAGAAALVLSRAFALRGAPGAAEHPELACSPGDVAAALALDAPAAFEHPFDGAMLEAQTRVLDVAGFDDGGHDWAKLVCGDLTPARWEERTRTAIALAPRHPAVLVTASHPSLGRLSAAPLLVLAARDGGVWLLELLSLFDGPERARLRADALQNPGAFRARPLPERWEVGSGLAPLEAVAAFDGALREDVERDPLVQELLRRGLARSELERAVQASRALRRIEVLRGEGLAPDLRARLGLEALEGLEALASLGGPTVLPLRARVRRALFAGPYGDSLVALDLERTGRVASSARDPRWLAEHVGHGVIHDPTWLLLAAAAAGATRGGSLDPRTRAGALFGLGIAWAHELAVEHTTRPGDWGAQDVEVQLRERHVALAQSWPTSELAQGVGAERLLSLFAPTPRDRERTRDGRQTPYAFERPSVPRR